MNLKCYKLRYQNYSFYWENGVLSHYKDGRLSHDYNLENDHEYFCLCDIYNDLVLVILPVEEVNI